MSVIGLKIFTLSDAETSNIANINFCEFSVYLRRKSHTKKKPKQQCASLLKTIVHCTVNQKLPDVVTRGFSVSNATMTSWALGEVKCASLPRPSGVSRNGKRMRELFMEGEGGKTLLFAEKTLQLRNVG